MKLMLSVATLLLLVGSVQAATSETFDIATFQTPSGWEKTAAPGVLTLKAPQGSAQIFLFPSRRNETSAMQEFQSDWTRLIGTSLGVSAAQQVSTEQTPDGWIAVSGAAAVAQQGRTTKVLLISATGHGRTATMVATWVDDAQATTIERFFAQIELRGSGTASPSSPTVATAPENRDQAPALSRGGSGAGLLPLGPGAMSGNLPSGLFYSLEVGIGTDRRLEARTRAFLPGNRIARVFPFGSGDVFDPAARCLPDTCGAYQLGAGQLVIRWDTGQVDRLRFQSTTQGIEIDGKLYKPARPLTARNLVGAWRDAGNNGGSMGNEYTFATDGSFTFGSGRNRLPGRFRVEGLTLILKFSDGTEHRRALFAAGGTADIGLICVENEVYARQ